MVHKAWNSIENVPFCFWRSSVKFKGHTAKKASISTQIRRFRTVTLVWMHQWLRISKWCKKLKVAYKRCPIYLFIFYLFIYIYIFWGGGGWGWGVGVIHQIWRSHGLKNRRFESNLSKITRPVAAIKSLWFAFALLWLPWWVLRTKQDILMDALSGVMFAFF